MCVCVDKGSHCVTLASLKLCVDQAGLQSRLSACLCLLPPWGWG